MTSMTRLMRTMLVTLPLLAGAALGGAGGAGSGTSGGSRALPVSGPRQSGAAISSASALRSPTASQIWLRFHLDTADLSRLTPAGDWPRPAPSAWEAARVAVAAEMKLHRQRVGALAPDALTSAWGLDVWEARDTPASGAGELRLSWRYGCGALAPGPQLRTSLNSGAHQFEAGVDTLRSGIDRLMFAVSRDLREEGAWQELSEFSGWRRSYRVPSEGLQYVVVTQALSANQSVACILTRAL